MKLRLAFFCFMIAASLANAAFLLTSCSDNSPPPSTATGVKIEKVSVSTGFRTSLNCTITVEKGGDRINLRTNGEVCKSFVEGSTIDVTYTQSGYLKSFTYPNFTGGAK